MTSKPSIYSRILRVLGQSVEAAFPKPVVVAEDRASKVRRKSVIVVDVVVPDLTYSSVLWPEKLVE